MNAEQKKQIKILLPAIKKALNSRGTVTRNKSTEEILNMFYQSFVAPTLPRSNYSGITQLDANYYEAPTSTFGANVYHADENTADKVKKGAEIVTSAIPVVGQVVGFFKDIFKKKKKGKNKKDKGQKLAPSEVLTPTERVLSRNVEMSAKRQARNSMVWIKYIPFALVAIVVVYLIAKK